MTRELIDMELNMIAHRLELLKNFFVNKEDGYSEGYVTAMDEAIHEIHKRIISNTK